jgi:divalent metal cation (Fe/Co/Zn/Cd) transporter
LIGEGVDRRTRDSIRQIVMDDPDIDRLVRALSMHFGPHDVLLTLEIQFRPELSGAQAACAVERLDKAIRSRHPKVRHIFVEIQAIAHLPGASNVAANRAASHAT